MHLNTKMYFQPNEIYLVERRLTDILNFSAQQYLPKRLYLYTEPNLTYFVETIRRSKVFDLKRHFSNLAGSFSPLWLILCSWYFGYLQIKHKMNISVFCNLKLFIVYIMYFSRTLISCCSSAYISIQFRNKLTKQPHPSFNLNYLP